MSADLELLQRAAAMILQRATGAAGEMSGPWETRILTDGRSWVAGAGDALSMHGYPSAAEHIASWDPAVALAVANMVHQAAVDLWAHGPKCACADGCIECDDNYWMPYARHALALARTYLKEQA